MPSARNREDVQRPNTSRQQTIVHLLQPQSHPNNLPNDTRAGPQRKEGRQHNGKRHCLRGFEVERIMSSRRRRNKWRYLVRWKPALVVDNELIPDANNIPYVKLDDRYIRVYCTMENGDQNNGWRRRVVLEDTWMAESTLYNTPARAVLETYKTNELQVAAPLQTHPAAPPDAAATPVVAPVAVSNPPVAPPSPLSNTITSSPPQPRRDVQEPDNVVIETDVPEARVQDGENDNHDYIIDNDDESDESDEDEDSDDSSDDESTADGIDPLTPADCVKFIEQWPQPTSTPFLEHDIFSLVKYRTGVELKKGEKRQTFNHRLVKQKPKRAVRLRPEYFDQRSKIKKFDMSSHGSRAFLLQATGQVMTKACSSCADSRGPFTQCVVDVRREEWLKDQSQKRLCFNGACACCAYMYAGAACSLNAKRLKRAAAVKRKSKRKTSGNTEGEREEQDEDTEMPDASTHTRPSDTRYEMSGALGEPPTPESGSEGLPIVIEGDSPLTKSHKLKKVGDIRQHDDHDDRGRTYRSDPIQYYGRHEPGVINIHTTIRPQLAHSDAPYHRIREQTQTPEQRRGGKNQQHDKSRAPDAGRQRGRG